MFSENFQFIMISYYIVNFDDLIFLFTYLSEFETEILFDYIYFF